MSSSIRPPRRSFKDLSATKFIAPAEAATKLVQMRYGCRTLEGESQKASARATVEMVDSVRMCREARRKVCASV